MRIRLSALLLAVLAVTGCSTENKMEQGRGSIVVSLAADDSTIDMSRASLGLTAPAAGDFALTVSNAAGVVGEWPKLSQYDTATTYDAGNYTASVSYGSTSVEAFETPCFAGQKEFAIIGGETTSVSIRASIANAVVRVACTDNFASYFPEYSFTLNTARGTALSFPRGETRRAFIDPYDFTISGTAKTQTGASVNIEKSFTGINPKTLYTVRFDVNSGNVGGATVTITFNDQPVAEIPVDIELNDDLK